MPHNKAVNPSGGRSVFHIPKFLVAAGLPWSFAVNRGQELSMDSDALPAVYSLDGLPVSSYREWLREWLRERREERSKKLLAERAMDAFEALEDRKTIRADDLRPIIEAARSPYIVAWDIGMHFLCR